MRNALSLLELVTVLVIVGLLAAVGNSLYRPDRLLQDVHFAALRLQRLQSRAIGYDHRNFDGTLESSQSCVTLDAAGLSQTDGGGKAYRIASTTMIGIAGMSGETLCFDAKGRPHEGALDLASLLHTRVDLNLSRSGKEYHLLIEPLSGFIIMY